MGLTQAQDAQAGAVAMSRVDAPFEDVADHGSGVRSGLFGPADQPLRRPFGMLAMALGHVLGLRAVSAFVQRAQVAGHPLVGVEALDGARRQAHLQLFFHQLIGHRVVMPIDLDVVVDMHPRLLPLGIDVRLLRQRAQRWPIQGLEGRVPGARQLAKRSAVEPLQQHADGAVELSKGEELPIPQRGEDPAFNHLHADLGLGLVTWFTCPRRHHRHAIVLGQVAVARVDVRLVAMRLAHRAAQVVRHHDLGHAAEEGEATSVRAQPVWQLLRPGGFGEGVAGSAEHRDEHLRLADLATVAVDHRHRLPGVIDEQLLADAVLLAHHHVQFALPGSIVFAEPAVLKALRLAQAVLLPKQRQGHAGATQLGMHPRPSGQWPLLAGHRRGRWEQLLLQLGTGQRTGPGETAGGKAVEVVADGDTTNLHTDRNLASR